MKTASHVVLELVLLGVVIAIAIFFYTEVFVPWRARRREVARAVELGVRLIGDERPERAA
jgi:hypothetical protein